MTEPAAAPPDLPPGFSLMPPMSGFGRAMGPWYGKRANGITILGFRVDDRHTNRLGIVHGGMMMAFADVVLSETGRVAIGKPSVTMRMTVDFVGPGRLGEWIEGSGEVSRATRNLVFVRARIWRGKHTLMTADGVFNFIRPRGEDGRIAPAAEEKQ